MTLFQLACIGVIAVAYGVLIKVRPQTLPWIPIILVTSWISEAASIYLHGFYRYYDFWWVQIGNVPVLVALIWPLVIITGREVVLSLWPDAGKWTPLLVGGIVFLDASLVEVAAVACGLWYWTEPGYLGVPLMGVIGWAIFAAVAAYLMEYLKFWGRLAALPAIPIIVHMLLLAAWWGLFRWVFQEGWFSLYAIAIAAAVIVVWRVRRQNRMDSRIAAVRVLAAGLFVVLMIFSTPANWPVWLHMGMLAVPYLLATDFSFLQRYSGAGFS